MIIYKKQPQPELPTAVNQGYIIVTQSSTKNYYVGFIANDGGKLMIHSINDGQFWGRQPHYKRDYLDGSGSVSLDMLMRLDHEEYSDGFRPKDIVAIYSHVKSWIEDGALGI